jgi:hypothetical protein
VIKNLGHPIASVRPAANGSVDEVAGPDVGYHALYDFPADPGCAAPDDGSEKCELGEAGCPECDDGFDQTGGDMDLVEDYRADGTGDPECASAHDGEGGRTACREPDDPDGDGLINLTDDPGCNDWGDGSELGLSTCDNGVDDDGDGRVDYKIGGSGDPGCASPVDDSETGEAACDNDLDDDGDGVRDFRWDGSGDQDCFGPADGGEAP